MAASTPTTTVLGRHLLRHAVYRLLARSERPMRVSEIVTAPAAGGYVTRRPPSRAVSDVLRTEVRAGRVDRIRRGTYAVHAPVDRAHLRYVDRALGELARHPHRRSASGTPAGVAHARWLAHLAGGSGTP